MHVELSPQRRGRPKCLAGEVGEGFRLLLSASTHCARSAARALLVSSSPPEACQPGACLNVKSWGKVSLPIFSFAKIGSVKAQAAFSRRHLVRFLSMLLVLRADVS